MDYHDLFLDSFSGWLAAYKSQDHVLHTEADFQSHLFAQILFRMLGNDFPKPYRIHTNYSVLTPREKIDLVLGDNEVLVELKFEPDYIGMPKTRKPVVLNEDIVRDFQRMERYASNGFPFCYAIILDEDGLHRRTWYDLDWHKQLQGRRNVHLLVRRFSA